MRTSPSMFSPQIAGIWFAIFASTSPLTGFVHAAAVPAQAETARSGSATAIAPARPASPTVEIVEIVKVVDGDTIHVRRKGAIEKLRLLSVDTEERLGPGHAPSATKPQTVFGEECALWAQEFFASLATEGEPARIGLRFPELPQDATSPAQPDASRAEAGALLEQRDVFGRLLCHVILPDGRDYNRLIVELGKSPYFNKYGNSTIDHAGFVAAQKAAQEKQLGIWNPATNEPTSPGAPSAKRPYARLLAWWDARAEAVEGFHRRQAETPAAVVDSDDPRALAEAAESGREVDLFGEVDRIFEEERGDRTVLMRASDRERALRVRIPLAARDAHVALDLESTTREFRQNYVYVRGTIRSTPRGFEMQSDDPARIRRAGPEPR